MSKFDAYHTLLSINPKEFLGIAKDNDEDNIITTMDKNVIIIVNAKTRMQVTSWSIKDKLSSKVIFDRSSHQYVGVFGCGNDSSGLYKSVLRCWDETTKDINKVKKIKFNKGIADLVCCDDSTYVLYYDGQCELLASAIESRKSENKPEKVLEILENKIQIENAKIFSCANGQRLLTFFEIQHLDDAHDSVNLVCVAIENGFGKNVVRFPLERNNSGTKLVGYTTIDGESSPVLVTIWSDKRVFLMKLDHTSKPADAPGKFVSIISGLKTDSALSVLGVSQQCIVIYAANNNQEGASLMLYNTQFKIIKSTQFFKVYFEFSRLWSIGEYIIMAMGQNLSVVNYHTEKETLADLLGCEIFNCTDQPVEADHINEEEALESNIEYQGFSDGFQAPPAPVTEVKLSEINDLVVANGETVAYEPIQEFDRDLSALKRLQMDVEIILSNKPVVDNMNIVLMSNRKDNGFVTQEIQYASQQLERCGSSEHEITEKLLTVLMKADIFKDIETTLRRYTNISELMIARTMSYTVKHILNENQEELESLKRILHLLISFSFDSTTLAVAVRHELQYEEVFYLLEYLYSLLADDHDDDDDDGAQTTKSDSEFDCLEFEMQVLKWLAVLLDAYFQKLALANDLRIIEVVYKWTKLLDSYKEELEDLNELSSVLYGVLNSKTSNQERDFSQWYTIEEVLY